MTHTIAQPESAGLGDILNKLANPRCLSGSDIAGEREKLAAISQNFNAALQPTAEQLAAALPKINDYGSRWITARMLRDTGLVNETKGKFALSPLCEAMASSKDAGMRYMIADLVRDLGVRHDSLAPAAAAAIAKTFVAETDAFSKNSQAGALMQLALKNEAAAPAALAAIAQALHEEETPARRIRLACRLRDLGRAWPSQAEAALKALTQAAEKETDFPVLGQMTQHVAAVALANEKAAEGAIRALAAGVRRETKSDGIAAYCYGLSLIAATHALPVIAAIAKDYEGFKGDGGADKRRMSIVTLTGLSGKGPMECGESARVLMKALSGESDAFHRRLIYKGLMECVRNGVESGPVRECLKQHLPDERDREGMETLERSLRSLGYIRPVANSLILAAPQL